MTLGFSKMAPGKRIRAELSVPSSHNEEKVGVGGFTSVRSERRTQSAKAKSNKAALFIRNQNRHNSTKGCREE
jgi:hypothetical protein